MEGFIKMKTKSEKDACKDCIRYRKFEVQICPECGQKAVETILDGPCMNVKCASCGYDVMGASFYAPCEQDRKKYMLKIVNKELSNQQIVKLRNLLHVRALEIKKDLNEEGCINKQFHLTRLLDIIQSVEAMGLAYSVEPELKYSRIFTCEKRFFRLKVIQTDEN